MFRPHALIAFLLVAGCQPNKDSKLNASDCGAQECPVGTAFSEYRADREGIDISGAVDPTTYSGEAAFSTFGESECMYQCLTINPCPENTFPVITADCFTCGVVSPDGEVNQGSCETGGSQTMDWDTGF